MKVLDANKQRIVQDEVLIVEAKVSNDDFTGGLRVIAEKLMTLGEARGRYARSLRLAVNGEVAASGGPRAAAEQLATLLGPYRTEPDAGGCPVRLRYRNQCAEADLPLGTQVGAYDSKSR